MSEENLNSWLSCDNTQQVHMTHTHNQQKSPPRFMPCGTHLLPGAMVKYEEVQIVEKLGHASSKPELLDTHKAAKVHIHLPTLHNI